MAKKTSGKRKAQQRTPSTRKAGAGARAMKASKGGRRKTAGAKTPAGKARKKSRTNPPRPGPSTRKSASSLRAGKGKKTAAKGAAGRKSGSARKAPASTRKAPAAARKKATKAAPSRKAAGGRTSAAARKPMRGGTGRESELAQTPETGRSVKGPTNPMKTRRSTGTPAGAGDLRPAPGLDRSRRRLREVEETVQGPPSSLDLDRSPSAARSGRRHMQDALEDANETGPVLTGGDVDADWNDAYAVGDEAPGGDNPTPDQDIVDEIGKALGVEYQDNEELKGADKIAERDKHRWELDPASSEDYTDRD
jgi:hypothetical protein